MLRDPERRRARCSSRSSRAYGVPLALERTVAARAHAARPRRCSRCCAARCSTAAPTTCSPGCARRALVRIAERVDRARGATVRRRASRDAAGARDAVGARARRRARRARPRCAAPRSAARRAAASASRARRRALLAAPWRRGAHRVGSTSARARDARVAAARLRCARCAELRRAAPTATRRSRPAPAELARMLAELPVARRRARRAPGASTVADAAGAPRAPRPRAVRAAACRRACSAAARGAEPFFGDDERRAIARRSACACAPRDDALDAERYLFYAAVSRPDELLVLALARGRRRRRAGGALALRRRRRRPVRRATCGDARAGGRSARVGLAAGEAPTEREAARAPRRRAARARRPRRSRRCATRGARRAARRPRGRPRSSRRGPAARCAGSSSGCLRPRRSSPTPSRWCAAALAARRARGRLAALRRAAGAVTPETLPRAARAAARGARASTPREHPISRDPERLRGALRRARGDLVRYLEHAAARRLALRARALRGRLRRRARTSCPPLELDDGELRLRGPHRPHRRRARRPGASSSTTRAGTASRRAPSGSTTASFQVALYLLAVRRASLGLEPVGGALPAARRRGPAPARRWCATTPTPASTALAHATASTRRSSTRCSPTCVAARAARPSREHARRRARAAGPTRAPGTAAAARTRDLPLRA